MIDFMQIFDWQPSYTKKCFLTEMPNRKELSQIKKSKNLVLTWRDKRVITCLIQNWDLHFKEYSIYSNSIREIKPKMIIDYNNI